MNSEDSRLLLLLLFLGVLMAALDIAIIGPALPAIKESFSLTDRAVAWVFTSYLLANLIGTPLMAKMSDFFGRRAVYILDLVLFAVGSVVVALAPSFSFVLIGRAVQGFGAGGIFPIASAVIGETFPPDKRGSALGLIGAVFGLAFLIGPIVGGLLLSYGWRYLFWGPLPFALFLLPMAWRVLPSLSVGSNRRADWLGIIVLGSLLFCLTLGLNGIKLEKAIPNLLDFRVWPYLLSALLLLLFFIWYEGRVSEPLIRPALLGTKQLRLAEFLSFGAGIVEGGIVFVPSLLVSAFKVSKSTSSFMLLPIVLAMAFGSPSFGRLLDKIGSRRVILLGTSLLTAGLILVSSFPISLVLFYCSAVLVGLGLSALLGAPIRYIMLNEASESDRASAQALVSLLTKIGQMVSGSLIGALASSLGGGVEGYQKSFLPLALFSAIMFISSWQLKSKEAERAPQISPDTSENVSI